MKYKTRHLFCNFLCDSNISFFYCLIIPINLCVYFYNHRRLILILSPQTVYCPSHFYTIIIDLTQHFYTHKIIKILWLGCCASFKEKAQRKRITPKCTAHVRITIIIIKFLLKGARSDYVY